MSGIARTVTKMHRNMTAAATKYIVLHPKYSPTMPLTTLEPRMPVSSPLSIRPTLRALFSGKENWETSGMNIWGVTEQMPVTNEAARI